VLRNLLTNGLKFTDSGEVHLAARFDHLARRVVLSVTDTGIGIAAADQDRVFEEFFQVRDAQRDASPGTGLGLPYARRLCALLGAELTLSSAPGEGSTFTVTLPRAPSDTLIGPGDLDPVRSARLSRVLVVDDDAAFRHRVRAVLEADGLTVTEAADGRAALDRVGTDLPDVIVLDLRMPVMGGLELLGELAGDPGTHAIPVLVVTAAELDDVARDAIGRAVAVLDKATFDERHLLDALHAAVAR
jgi:CheY-like chemotaxis protein